MKENKPYDTYVLCIYPICHDGILVWKIHLVPFLFATVIFSPLQTHNGNVKKQQQQHPIRKRILYSVCSFSLFSFHFISFYSISLRWYGCAVVINGILDIMPKEKTIPLKMQYEQVRISKQEPVIFQCEIGLSRNRFIQTHAQRTPTLSRWIFGVTQLN